MDVNLNFSTCGNTVVTHCFTSLILNKSLMQHTSDELVNLYEYTEWSCTCYMTCEYSVFIICKNVFKFLDLNWKHSLQILLTRYYKTKVWIIALNHNFELSSNHTLEVCYTVSGCHRTRHKCRNSVHNIYNK